MKFSALNVNFSRLSPDLLGLREPAHESVEVRYLLKTGYLGVVGLPIMKVVADRHRHAAYHNKH